MYLLRHFAATTLPPVLIVRSWQLFWICFPLWRLRKMNIFVCYSKKITRDSIEIHEFYSKFGLKPISLAKVSFSLGENDTTKFYVCRFSSAAGVFEQDFQIIYLRLSNLLYLSRQESNISNKEFIHFAGGLTATFNIFITHYQSELNVMYVGLLKSVHGSFPTIFISSLPFKNYRQKTIFIKKWTNCSFAFSVANQFTQAFTYTKTFSTNYHIKRSNVGAVIINLLCLIWKFHCNG